MNSAILAISGFLAKTLNYGIVLLAFAETFLMIMAYRKMIVLKKRIDLLNAETPGKMVLRSKKQGKLETEYSNDIRVNRTTPRAFIALSDDDRAVPAANGFNYYSELYRHDVPASIHIYPTGGHGWGYRETFAFHYEMIFELKAWLESF